MYSTLQNWKPQPEQDGDNHGPGGGDIWAETVVHGPGHHAPLIDEPHRVVVPVAGPDIGKGQGGRLGLRIRFGCRFLRDFCEDRLHNDAPAGHLEGVLGGAQPLHVNLASAAVDDSDAVQLVAGIRVHGDGDGVAALGPVGLTRMAPPLLCSTETV